MPHKPSVLIGGKKNIFRWPENVAEAFYDAGCRTSTFLINRRSSILRILTQIGRKTDQESIRRLCDQTLAMDFRKIMVKTRPDLIFFVSPFFLPESLFSILQAIPDSIRTAGWIGDQFGSEMKKRADELDHLYCSDSTFIGLSQFHEFKSPASLLPHAFNPRIFHASSIGTRQNELVFIGTCSRERAAVFNQLTEASCRIIGPKWHPLNSCLHTVVSRKIPLRKTARIYQQSRAVLNIRSFDNVIAGLNMRTFEAAACGAAVLNDDLADLPLCFEPGREIFVYRSIEELNEQAARITQKRSQATLVAEAGRKRAEQEHTYRHRIEKILQDLL